MSAKLAKEVTQSKHKFANLVQSRPIHLSDSKEGCLEAVTGTGTLQDSSVTKVWHFVKSRKGYPVKCEGRNTAKRRNYFLG